MSNFFDPKGFSAGGFLDGQVADIVEIKATKFDYNGTVDPPANVIEIDFVRADGKTRTEVYGLGQSEPTDDGNNISKAPNASAKAAVLFTYLAKTKFPIAKLGSDGLVALKGQRFTWKNVGKGGKDIFVPASYVGLADGSAAEVQAKEGENREFAQGLVRSIVTNAGEAGIKKAALPAKVAALLKDSPEQKQAVTAFVLSDEFLNTVPGVNYEKGTLSLIQG